jgi:uncharacterized protein YjiS (DUF1127 family)
LHKGLPTWRNFKLLQGATAMIDSLIDERAVFAKRAPNIGCVIKLAIIDAMQAWRAANAKRRIAIQLSILSDHMLKDIGVSRDMIYVAACRLAAADSEDRQA